MRPYSTILDETSSVVQVIIVEVIPAVIDETDVIVGPVVSGPKVFTYHGVGTAAIFIPSEDMVTEFQLLKPAPVSCIHVIPESSEVYIYPS